jgi:lipid A 3-O-deacylase
MGRRRLAPLVGAAFVLLFGTMAAAAAQEPDHLSFSLGMFDALKQDDEAGEARIEYRSGWRLFDLGGWFRGIGPMLGLMANTDGAVFGYGALYVEVRPTDRLSVRPSAGIGGYHQGDSIDQGGVFQFHLGATIDYRLGNSHRLGVSYAHISNSRIYEENPGIDSLLVTYSIPFGPLVGPGGYWDSTRP